jgi:hypothetical protein
MNRTPKETIYDAEISPLMGQIIAICKQHKINMAATFSLDFDQGLDETLFCTTILPVDRADTDGYQAMQECRRVMELPASVYAMTITTMKSDE